MFRRALLPALAVCVAAVPQSLNAQYIGLTQWTTGPGSNGHYYAMTQLEGDYRDVSEVAARQGGTLASITTSAENDFVYNSLIAFGSCSYSWCAPATYFIGLERVSVGGPFVWQTGEVVSYTAWNSGEPNDRSGGWGPEMVAHVFQPPGGSVVWNDVPYGTPNSMRGVIEWNQDPRMAVVPEPSTWVMMATGLLLLGLVALRRRREGEPS